jgi:hypothetical protein
VWPVKLNLKDNIHAVCMHMRQAVTGVLKDFVNKRPITETNRLQLSRKRSHKIKQESFFLWASGFPNK